MMELMINKLDSDNTELFWVVIDTLEYKWLSLNSTSQCMFTTYNVYVPRRPEISAEYVLEIWIGGLKSRVNIRWQTIEVVTGHKLLLRWSTKR